jgi:urocanate hydratase
MTAGSYMYIGPQGIVHGSTITILNAARILTNQRTQGNKISSLDNENEIKLFVSSGLGGMSGAQAKAGVIAGVIAVIAEINPKAIQTRHKQGWVDEVYLNIDELISRIIQAKKDMQPVSLAYQGNIVDLWEKLVRENINVDLGSDQTSLHNPFSGGYYPVGLSFEEANYMMANEPEKFKNKVYESLIRQVKAINILSQRGMYFWDYGNAFLLEAGRAGTDIFKANGDYIYPSYVQDIMGPMCFDYGFGPFRWICTSGDPNELAITDKIAEDVLTDIYKTAPKEIKQQLSDNLIWIKNAQKNKLVVGSQARILYADCEGRIRIAKAFNKAIKDGILKYPVIIGRDHHDVSGTDSPFRETSNIYDGSKFTADMAIHNVIGDAFRGATWVSIHNGGGVGWGEVINGGFGLLLDGTSNTEKKIQSMLFWDVNNGIARRSWARNEASIFSIKNAMEKEPLLKITLPNLVNKNLLNSII